MHFCDVLNTHGMWLQVSLGKSPGNSYISGGHNDADMVGVLCNMYQCKIPEHALEATTADGNEKRCVKTDMQRCMLTHVLI